MLKEKKLLKILFLIGAGLFLVISLFFIFQGGIFSSLLRSSKTDISDFGKELHYLEQVAKTGDISICDKTNDRESCIIFAAKVKEDISICNEIKEKEHREISLQTCYSEVFSVSKDEEICKRMPSDLSPLTRERCYFLLAKHEGNSDYCSKTKDFSDSCYYNTAIKNQSFETCSKIFDNELRNYCYYYNSISGSNIRPCRLIEEDDMRNLCFGEVSLKSSYCKNIGNYFLANYCNEEIAKKTKDLDLCWSEPECVTFLATQENNLEFCNDIFSSNLREDCRIAVAIQNDNPQKCLSDYFDQESKANCLIHFSIKNKNSDYCNLIPEKEFKERDYIDVNLCLFHVARTLNNPSICQKIKDKDERNLCDMNTKVSGSVGLDYCKNIEEKRDLGVYDKINCYYDVAVKENDYKICDEMVGIINANTTGNPHDYNYKDKKENCYSKILTAKKEEFLEKFKKQNPSAVSEEGIPDSIIVTLGKGEGVTHAAEKALNNYLDRTSKNYSLKLGQRLFIEDYLKDKKPSQTYYLGEEISFSVNLIKEAIKKSKELSQKEIENLSKYTYGRTELDFNLLDSEKRALNYCNFMAQNYKNYYQKDRERQIKNCKLDLTGNLNICYGDYQCLSYLTEKTNNYLLCENFRYDRTSFGFYTECYSEFAEKMNKPDLCNFLKKGYDYCIYPFKQKEEEKQDKKYYDKALEENDSQYCDLVVDPNEKKDCYVKLAKRNNDISVCEKVVDSEREKSIKNYCFEAMDRCDKIVSKEMSQVFSKEMGRAFCYEGLIEKKKSLYKEQECSLLNNEEEKDICFASKTDQAQSINFCRKIDNEIIKDICEYEYSIKNNKNHCGLIGFRTRRDDCYQKFAIDNRDYRLCLKIDYSYEKGHCINNLANLLENKDLCNYLKEDNFYKSSCGERYKGARPDNN